mgnify:FL=1
MSSRHTNQSNSVTPGETRNSADSETPSDELPTPRECLAEFVDLYDDRANLRVTHTPGTRLRRDYAIEETQEYVTDKAHERDTRETGHEVTANRPVKWGTAVYRMLKDHVENRQTKINLTRGYPDDAEYAEFSVDAETRWMSSYQKRYYAEMNGWLRELCGGDRPSGGQTTASYDDPHIALVTLSGSSTPDGERLGPVDHANALRESWSDVYHTLRNTMRSKGLNWQYDRRSEPHTGKRGDRVGRNSCYSHDHIVIVVDGAVTPADFRPLIEKHVETCEIAAAQAHDLDIQDWNANSDDVGTVTVRKPENLENTAAYVADYCSIEPSGRLDRAPEYQAWAAAVNAGNIRTVTRSDAANHAATADSCKQRAESDRADQTDTHGENLRRSDRRGHSIECAECGSPHGIDQDQTLSAARIDADATAAADGGLDVDEARRDDLRDRWPSARAAAQTGETATRAQRREQVERALTEDPDASTTVVLARTMLPPDCRDLVHEVRAGLDRDNAVGFERAPSWSVDSITVGETTYPARNGGGVDLVEASGLPDETLALMNERLLEGTRYRCDCGVAAYAHPNGGIAGHLRTHGITDPDRVKQFVTPD